MRQVGPWQVAQLVEAKPPTPSRFTPWQPWQPASPALAEYAWKSALDCIHPRDGMPAGGLHGPVDVLAADDVDRAAREDGPRVAEVAARALRVRQRRRRAVTAATGRRPGRHGRPGRNGRIAAGAERRAMAVRRGARRPGPARNRAQRREARERQRDHAVDVIEARDRLVAVAAGEPDADRSGDDVPLVRPDRALGRQRLAARADRRSRVRALGAVARGAAEAGLHGPVDVLAAGDVDGAVHARRPRVAADTARVLRVRERRRIAVAGPAGDLRRPTEPARGGARAACVERGAVAVDRAGLHFPIPRRRAGGGDAAERHLRGAAVQVTVGERISGDGVTHGAFDRLRDRASRVRRMRAHPNRSPAFPQVAFGGAPVRALRPAWHIVQFTFQLVTPAGRSHVVALRASDAREPAREVLPVTCLAASKARIRRERVELRARSIRPRVSVRDDGDRHLPCDCPAGGTPRNRRGWRSR